MWGAVKCTGRLTGSAAKLGSKVAKGRCRLTLQSLAVDYPGDASLADLRKKVTESLLPRGPSAKEDSAKYRDIVLRAASPIKFAAESILADFGYSVDRKPPYEKRPGGAELWWGTVKNFYRFESAAERRERGVASVVSERLKRTSAREAAWYLSRTNDFALAVADRKRDIIIRLDSDLDAALRRCDIERADAQNPTLAKTIIPNLALAVYLDALRRRSSKIQPI